MTESSTSFQNSRNNRLVFILSIITALYWSAGKFWNVYDFAFSGAVYELLWLPMLASIFIIPLVSLVFYVNDKFNLRSLALYSFLIMSALILMLVFSGNK